jgi:TolB-like protein/DNA-binding winged helix-turn-helix (wHTH) protein/Flp pilus assembly protein TadD
MQALELPQTIAFGPFVLDLGARALLSGGEKLAISSRAFDILVLLVSERDRVVGKDEILAKVWRGMAVEENNLAVQISSLRRVLSQHADGQAMITTVPGQGYRFVARVEGSYVAPPAFSGHDMEVPPALPPPAFLAPPRLAQRRLVYAAAAASLVLVLVIGWFRFAAPSDSAPRLSLAVLPFRNLGDDPKQDYLADAISDDLTTDLSHLPGSVVIARESSDAYKGRAVPAPQIGRALHVRYLLEGSVRGVDGIFKINAQLIDATNGAHLWADRFDVARDKMADAQNAIVAHIASALNVKLVALEGSRSLIERPNDPDALDLYFRARSIRDRAETLAEFTEAQKLLEKAMSLQPSFVDALADLGLVLLAKVTDFDDPDDSLDWAKAKQSIDQALTLAPRNANALTAQGWLLSFDGRVREGMASYQAAVSADPNNVLARAGLATLAWRLGEPEQTITALGHVLELDPQGPAVKRRMALLGMAYFMIGKFQDSIDWLLRSLAGDPKDTSAGIDRLEFSHAFLIAAYDCLGDKTRAHLLYDDYRARWANRSVWRLSNYFTKAQVSLSGFKMFRSALAEAGMPAFSLGVTTSAKSLPADNVSKGDFDPAPGEIPNALAIDIADLPKFLSSNPPPLIIDVGLGAATLREAVWVSWPHAQSGGLEEVLRQHKVQAGTPVIVVAIGFYGWSSYVATMQVQRFGVRPVFWLRGGEEAIAASGYPSVDRRQP